MTVTPTDLAERLRSAAPPCLLDVREEQEHAFCALPGSRLLPLSELAERAGELDDWRGVEVVVYCHHGVRSAHAVAWLRSQGFGKARNLSGGIDRWSLEIEPTLARY